MASPFVLGGEAERYRPWCPDVNGNIAARHFLVDTTPLFGDMVPERHTKSVTQHKSGRHFIISAHRSGKPAPIPAKNGGRERSIRNFRAR
jgi:hypothetical protein